MREIRFRGKRIDNGEWVAGHYLTRRSDEGLKHMISVQDMWGFHEVDPETVGQYIGLKDRNGKEGYKGDVIGFSRSMRAEIVWSYAGWELKWIDENTKRLRLIERGFERDSEPMFRNIHLFEIIGNIYANPELLTP